MNSIPPVKIDLPPEAKLVMMKCTNRGLILNRHGQVFEMHPGLIYRINDDGSIESQSISLTNQEEVK